MWKKIVPVLIVLAAAVVALGGCSKPKEVYQEVYLDVFDTVSTLRGYESESTAFTEKSEKVHAALLEYHQLFDIYHDYPKGIKAINDNAGIAPVEVDPSVMALLLDCRAYAEMTHGRVNIAMGSVLKLWHEAREAGIADPEHASLPDFAALQEAAGHCSFDTVILDEEHMTAFISDPEQSLDVGAIAKGWAAQKVSQTLPEGYYLNLGGNVCTRGIKPDGTKWFIGIQSPDSLAEYLCVVGLDNLSAVTSGDYQRSFTVDGKAYHHIIDPDTLMPSAYWRSVSILCPDSGLADCLSTALFLMNRADGEALLQQCSADAMWVDAEGNTYATPGFEAMIRK